MVIYIYSHLPKSYIYDIFKPYFTNINSTLVILDIQDMLVENININKDILFVYEPQNSQDLQYLINLSKLFKKENTYILFYENVIDSVSLHKWKNNSNLLDSFGYIFSPNYRIVDNKHFYWGPTHHTILNYGMINTEYLQAYRSNKSYSGIKYDIVNNRNINNCLDKINIIKEYKNKAKFLASQPIAGSVNDYRINIIKEIEKYCDIDTYGSHIKLRTTKNYKGFISISNSKNIYSNRRERSVATIETLTNYKFNLILENECIDGYFSERFIDGLCSSSIPIYFGCKNPEKIFPELFNYVINGYKFTSKKDLIDFISNMSKEEYTKRITYINNNLKKYLLLFSQENIMNYIIYKMLNKDYETDELKYLYKINLSKNKII